jgi:hypothetical protein
METPDIDPSTITKFVRHYRKNKEKVLATVRKYQQEHAEEFAATQKKYQAANREIILAKKHEYCKANAEHIAKKKAETTVCEYCDATYTKCHVGRHRATQKCMAAQRAKEAEVIVEPTLEF